MTILLPLGLLGLLSLVLLFLIYFLKPKYEEQKISSTFIWKLSLEYQKQKVPFQWLKSSLVLILQILILLAATFLLIKPLILLPNENGDRIIVLESSASMMTEDKGETRFDRAIDEIEKIAATASDAKKVTIILAGTEATYVVRREVNPDIIRQSLSNANCELGEGNVDEALELAGAVKDENADATIMLFGSKDYEDAGIVTVRNMSSNEWNAAILDFTVEHFNGYYEFKADVASFNKNTTLTVTFLIDGEITDVQSIRFNDNEIVELDYTDKLIYEYNYAELRIEADDALTYDNTFFLFGGNENVFTVQLVSDRPRFMRTSLDVVGDVLIDEIPATPVDLEQMPEDYVPKEVQYENYDLYVFDGFEPEKLPEDGAVWILNPVDGSSLKGLDSGSLRFSTATEFGLSVQLDKEEELSNDAKEIANAIDTDKLTISKNANIASSQGFETIFTCRNQPALLYKNDNGVKITVFTFDLAYSNLPITIYMPLLVSNLYNISLEHTVDEYLYTVGNMIELNSKPSALSMTINANSEEKTYTSFPVILDLNTPGVYNVSQSLKSGYTKEDSFFVRIPRIESDSDYKGGELKVPLANPDVTEGTSEKETYDLVFILAGIILILVVVEWRVQYREQY